MKLKPTHAGILSLILGLAELREIHQAVNSQAMIPFLTFLRLPLSTLILWLAWKRLSGGSSSNAQAINSYSSHCHAWAVGFILSQELFFGSILCCELLETCPKKLIIFKTYLLINYLLY